MLFTICEQTIRQKNENEAVFKQCSYKYQTMNCFVRSTFKTNLK